MQLVLILLLTIVMSSCSTRSSVSRNHAIVNKIEINSVPFIAQEDYQCGPASLAMIFNHLGKKTTASELSSQVFTPGRKGSLQTDIITSVRRHGLISTPLNTVEELLREIEQGNPVLILQNLAFDWFPRWHYAVVIGYDYKNSEIILHSGESAKLRLSFFTFEKTWKRAKSWGLVIVVPGEIAASADELEILKASAHLEESNFLKEAASSYQAILKKWPNSLGALIGLGNIYFTQKDYKNSVAILEIAVKKYPDSDVVLNNYSLARDALATLSKK
jgi:ABC-type bacteriocin/lantibiotic exporter with double-glycine peptidase domain